MVEISNEHLLYLVSDWKTPWHLPHSDSFLLLTKVVISHLAKSKCKLAVYTKVDWTRPPPLTKGMLPICAYMFREDADKDEVSLPMQRSRILSLTPWTWQT